jgi:hypothetical protein
MLLCLQICEQFFEQPNANLFGKKKQLLNHNIDYGFSKSGRVEPVSSNITLFQSLGSFA